MRKRINKFTNNPKKLFKTNTSIRFMKINSKFTKSLFNMNISLDTSNNINQISSHNMMFNMKMNLTWMVIKDIQGSSLPESKHSKCINKILRAKLALIKDITQMLEVIYTGTKKMATDWIARSVAFKTHH